MGWTPLRASKYQSGSISEISKDAALPTRLGGTKNCTMPGFETIFAFIAAVLIMQVTPGPDMMLIIGRGVGQGWQVALCTVLGMTLLAGLVQLPLLVLGLASLLQSSPLLSRCCAGQVLLT
jgi:hypothetical protein